MNKSIKIIIAIIGFGAVLGVDMGVKTPTCDFYKKEIAFKILNKQSKISTPEDAGQWEPTEELLDFARAESFRFSQAIIDPDSKVTQYILAPQFALTLQSQMSRSQMSRSQMSRIDTMVQGMLLGLRPDSCTLFPISFSDYRNRLKELLTDAIRPVVQSAEKQVRLTKPENQEPGFYLFYDPSKSIRSVSIRELDAYYLKQNIGNINICRIQPDLIEAIKVTSFYTEEDETKMILVLSFYPVESYAGLNCLHPTLWEDMQRWAKTMNELNLKGLIRYYQDIGEKNSAQKSLSSSLQAKQAKINRDLEEAKKEAIEAMEKRANAIQARMD